jgi:hypothetical protein
MTEVIETRVVFFAPESGGRNSPVDAAAGVYAPHLRVGPEGELLGVRLVAGPPELRPGEPADVVWELLYGGVDYSPLRVGRRFQILEGRQVIGEGKVTDRRPTPAGRSDSREDAQ